MHIVDYRVSQDELDNSVIVRDTITIKQSGNAQSGAIAYMPFAGDIVAVTFMNNSGAAFTAAANIAVTAGTVVSSTANLADGTTELDDTGLTNNTGLAEGDAITLTTGTTIGTGDTVAIIAIQAKLNSVV